MSDMTDLMTPAPSEEKLKALNEAKEKVRARFNELLPQLQLLYLTTLSQKRK